MMAQHVAPAPAPHSRPSHDDAQPTLLDRTTKSGRRLWYKLTVIQQPERARACGSGPKSSADRRPVDPPPVVELRIFEGHTWQEAESKDITFLYNANFFLYATLEHSRVIAHGRVQTPAANQPPVLTGMPVSGMAYLDRPQEAGYFLFPDLSVRHEGRYILNFNLYEETKEDKDKDPDTPDQERIAPGFSHATGGSFDFRMEVKSRDFVVYSAKKFPGLKESTQISRVVAEQGCRVRIRRDVRMRRRDGKPGGDYDDGNDAYAARRRDETPEMPQKYRPRSMSRSVERNSFPGEPPRRPSGADYAPPPFASHQPHSVRGHLQFLGNAAHVQYPHQAQSSPKPPSMPPSPSAYQTAHGAPYPPHPHSAGHQTQSGAQSQHGHMAPQTHQSAYGPPPPHQPYHQPERSQSQSQFYAPNPPAQREPAPREFREPYGLQCTSNPASHQSRGPALAPAPAPAKEFNLLPPMARSNTPLTLPPITDFAQHLAPRAMAPLSSPTECLPPLQPMPAVNKSILPPPPTIAGSKRTRDDIVRYDVDVPRYHNGAREDPQLFDDQGEPSLIYRRANGAEIEVKNTI